LQSCMRNMRLSFETHCNRPIETAYRA